MLKRDIIIKYSVLAILVLQNSGLTLTMRYSRIVLPQASLYIPSTAVLLSELIKLIWSCMLYYRLDCESSISRVVINLKREFSEGWFDFLGLTVPSGLYVVQNNLQYIASTNLSAVLFQVLSQMKIITTAIFAVLLLGRRPSCIQWTSVIALTCGIAIVNVSQQKQLDTNTRKSHFIGITCILCGACTSGFAGIYFERMVKSTPSSIWVRNIQMSLIGTIISGLACAGKDFKVITAEGFFKGYTSVVWGVILLQAIGGLVVAMVVKYADNILKGFATSGSIILSCIMSAYLFRNTNSESELNLMFVIGAAVVCLAAFFYGYNPSSASSSISKSIDNDPMSKTPLLLAKEKEERGAHVV